MEYSRYLYLVFFLFLNVISGPASSSSFVDGVLRFRIIDENNVSVVLADTTNRQSLHLDSILTIPGHITYQGACYQVSVIDEDAFSFCPDLQEVVIGEGVEVIGAGAFSQCSSLRTIKIPSSVSFIEAGMTKNCASLREIIVAPDNPFFDSRNDCHAIIRKKDDALVCGCASTVIPEGVKSIADGAFYGCEYLDAITLPESLTSIGTFAFYGCLQLKELLLPDALKRIGCEAFAVCRLLREINIPKNVSEIEPPLFCGCASLKKVTVAEDNQLYDSRQDCNAIIETATNTLVAAISTTSIVDGIARLGDFSFAYTGITSLHLPKSLVAFGDGVFNGCQQLVEISVDENHPVFNSNNECNAIIDNKTKSLLVGCVNTVIDEGITSIAKNAFRGNRSPNRLFLPEGVVSIGDYAFSFCRELEMLRLPKSLKSIGTGAFEGCCSLMEVHCESNQTIEVKPRAFDRCNMLPFRITNQ
ncbi:MAG: leucine-rich repeat protein [Prevotella sp.]|nr:leucine-rich repeat protein [Prevotella sp.]